MVARCRSPSVELWAGLESWLGRAAIPATRQRDAAGRDAAGGDGTGHRLSSASVSSLALEERSCLPGQSPSEFEGVLSSLQVNRAFPGLLILKFLFGVDALQRMLILNRATTCSLLHRKKRGREAVPASCDQVLPFADKMLLNLLPSQGN